MSDELPQHLHSAAYFGDARDFWWNADFVALVARRTGLDAVTRALDAGCGLGHWGRVLLPHMPRAALDGVDREPQWIDEAARRTAAAGWGDRARYRTGAVEALPFDDATFDLVTCQTVLIHVPDVARVLREFQRVLRPGGRLLVAEPHNMSGAMVLGSVRHDDEVDARLAVLRVHMICERGKIALGEGDNSVGEVLPGIIAQVGFRDVAAWQSDRTQLLLPPYAAPDQAAARDELLDHWERGYWNWSRDDTRRYYLAGGGREVDFDADWSLCRASIGREIDALRAGTFHTASGGSHYVITALRP